MAEPRAFLGLTHNPFVKPDQGFFERGDRKTHLEQLRHLGNWSRRVLLVTGPTGVGKSTLYRQLSASLEPQVKAARVNGMLINTSREVVQAIVQGFGLAAPSDANYQLLKSLVEEHVAEQEKAGRQCVVLVDDAQELEPRAIDDLIGMSDRSGLRMVLFGEVPMVGQVERAADRAGVGWHEIRLSGFGDADTREYLEWRFRQARYRGRIPFTDEQVRDIARMSEGLPGRVNQMANVLLVKLESGSFKRPRALFPRQHAALLLVLAIATLLVYVLFRGDNEGETVEPVALPAREHVEAAPTAAQTADIETEADTARDVADAEANAAPEAFAQEIESDVPREQSPVEPPVAAVGESIDDAGSAAAPTAEAVPVPAAPAVEPEPAVEEPVAKQPEPVEAGPRDGRWLLAQDPEAFTVQLVTLSSLERASAFVAEQKDPERYAIYQLERDGRVLHVVVYGVFATREAATRAVAGLSGSAARVQPWIRPLAQVHGAIRTVERR